MKDWTRWESTEIATGEREECFDGEFAIDDSYTGDVIRTRVYGDVPIVVDKGILVESESIDIIELTDEEIYEIRKDLDGRLVAVLI